MTTSTGHIACLYMREKTLRAITVFFFGCVFLTFIPGVIERLYLNPAWMRAFQSTIIMLALWMAFLIGIILKRQFATHRASLLPGYRSAHVLVFALMFAALVTTGILWSVYLAKLFHVGFDMLLAVVASGVFVALITIVLGYLCVAWLVIFSFIVFCLFSDPVYLVVAGMLGDTPTNIMTLLITGIVLAVFLKRFLDVREECWEYPYIFAWSGRQNTAGYNANWSVTTRSLVVLRKIFGFKNDITVTSNYSSARGLFARAMHWECLKLENYKLGLLVLLALTPLYVFYIHLVPGHFAVLLKGHLKYFLLGIYPVVLSAGLNQKGIAHWGYDLTKPVGRGEFIREKGTGILVEIALYWLLALIFGMVIPYGILDPQRLFTANFWAEMMLTLSFALMTFGWIACLRGTSSGRTVLSLIGLGVLSGYQFYTLPSTDLTGVIAKALVWLIMGVLLCRIARRKWMNAEFD